MMLPPIPPPPKITALHVATDLIAVFEGCRLTAYQDTGGIWTIGFGHTGADVKQGMTITQAQAEALFQQDQQPLLKLVGDRPVLEAAAMVSFGYNCGIGTLSRVLHSESLPNGDAMKVEMADFVKDHKGNVLDGLVRRRKLEATLVAYSRQSSAA